MIVRKNKAYETNLLFLNTNWYEGEDNYVVDETIEEGKILAEKIQAHAPYFDFVLDEEGNLIDITPLPRPEPEPTVPIPTTEERLLAIEEVLLNLL